MDEPRVPPGKALLEVLKLSTRDLHWAEAVLARLGADDYFPVDPQYLPLVRREIARREGEIEAKE